MQISFPAPFPAPVHEANLKQSTKTQAGRTSWPFKTLLINRYASLHLRAGEIWGDAKQLLEQVSVEINPHRALKGLGVALAAGVTLYCLYHFSRYSDAEVLNNVGEILKTDDDEALTKQQSLLPLPFLLEKNQTAEISHDADSIDFGGEEPIQKSQANLGEHLPNPILIVVVSIAGCFKAFKQAVSRERLQLLEETATPLIAKSAGEEEKKLEKALNEIECDLNSLLSPELQDALQKKQKAEAISNSLLELSNDETFKAAIEKHTALKEKWASLYIASSALSMYLLQSLDLEFLVNVHASLKKKVSCNDNISLNRLNKLIEDKRIFLSEMLEPFIYAPMKLADSAHLVFNVEDKVLEKIPLRFLLNSDNFVNHAIEKIVKAFTAPVGALDDIYKPMEAISKTLAELGYYETKCKEITVELASLVRINQFDKAFQKINEHLDKGEVCKKSESCRSDVKKTLIEIQEVLEGTALTAPSKIGLTSVSGTCREKVLSALRLEKDIWLEGYEEGEKDRSRCSVLLEDFPKVEDLTEEEWNQLAGVPNDKLTEVLLQKHIKKVKEGNGFYTWKKLIEPKRSPISMIEWQ
jgi:uncharacterized OsmC-like protein